MTDGKRRKCTRHSPCSVKGRSMEDKALAIVKGNAKICAGYLPQLKKPCLYVYTSKCSIRKVATFNDHEAAELFMNYLADMIGAREKEQ